jgi:hypothetical protein
MQNTQNNLFQPESGNEPNNPQWKSKNNESRKLITQRMGIKITIRNSIDIRLDR